MSQNTYQAYVPVRFRMNNKDYYFGCYYDDLSVNDQVVVETSRGLELGYIVSKPKPIAEYTNSELELKPVLRLASEEDKQAAYQNTIDAQLARPQIEEAIAAENLLMRIASVEYTLDKSKLIVTYLADGRVDFRELLRRLTSIFYCRIELRQIGHRDKSKLVGGVGVCGNELCCSRFLQDFEGISINMAKNQLMSLNIQKLTGQCGKLKCCLRYENDLYSLALDSLPKIGSEVEFKKKKYKVNEINILSRKITLYHPDERITISLDEFLQPEKVEETKTVEPLEKVKTLTVEATTTAPKRRRRSRQRRSQAKPTIAE